MSSSPAWLTIALTTLANVPENPALVLESGTRTLPSPHILNHLNRWARHVWRPAVTSRSLAALTRSPTREPLHALGLGPVSLLAALIDAVRRCNVPHWLDVIGVMFLADDPWVIEVGRRENPADVDRAAGAMKALHEQQDLLTQLLAELADKQEELGLEDVEDGCSRYGEGFAELRCRVAALQLQLDDVTSVVRRNEKNTKDLLSSFHFWSLLLLDELRSYRSQERSLDGVTPTDGMLESLTKQVGQIMNRPLANTGTGSASASELSRESSNTADADSKGRERRRTKRIFRDGKWVDV